MANANDSAIITYMLSMPDELMAEYFARSAHKIIDDATYWNVLGTLWKGGGTVVQQNRWKEMFNSDRPKRHKMMKKRERKTWKNLPSSVLAYRAINNPEEMNSAISWSLSEEVVKKVFSEDGKRKIACRKFKKSEIFAFFDRRGEDEILVNI